MTTTPAPIKAVKKRRWHKIVVISLGVLLVLALLLPTLLSFGPGKSILLSQINSRIPGRIEIDSLSLGWFSAASAHGVRLYDPEGQLAATVADLTTPISLLGAIRGKFDGDMGINITQGNVDLDKNNILRSLVKPSTAPTPAKPASPFLTKNNITIHLANVNITAKNSTLTLDSGTEIKTTLDTRGGATSLNATLKLHDAAHPTATITLDAAAEAFSAGKLVTDINAMNAHGSLALQGLELAAAQPFLNAADMQLNIAGTAETLDKPLAFNLTNRSLTGTLKITDATATGQFLKGDTLEKQTITIPLNITWAKDIYTIDAQFNSSLMNLTAKGTLADQIAAAFLQGQKVPACALVVTGNVAVSAAARQFPHSLSLKPATKITAGTASLTGTITVAGDVPSSTLDVTLSNVTGTEGPSPIALLPIQLHAEATYKNGRLTPAAALKMPADAPNAPGGQIISLGIAAAPDDANKFTLKGNYDVTQLNVQIAQFVDLQGQSFSGDGTLSGFIAMDPKQNTPAKQVLAFSLITDAQSLLAHQFPAPGDTIINRRLNFNTAGIATITPNGLTAHFDSLNLTAQEFQLASGPASPNATIAISASGTADLTAKTFIPDSDLTIKELDPQIGLGNTVTITKGGKISWGTNPMDFTLTTSYTLDRVAAYMKALSPSFTHTLAGTGQTTFRITGTVDGPITFDGSTKNPLIAFDSLLPPNFDIAGPLSGSIALKPYFSLTATAIDLKGKQIALAINKSVTLSLDPKGMLFSADSLHLDVPDLAVWNSTFHALNELPATSALKGHASVDGTVNYGPSLAKAGIVAKILGFQQLSSATGAAGQPAALAPTNITASINADVDLHNSIVTFTDNSAIQEQDPAAAKPNNSVTFTKGSILSWATGKDINASLTLAYDLPRLSVLLKPWLPASLTSMTGTRTLTAAKLTGRLIDLPPNSTDTLKKFSQLELTTISPGFDQIVYGGFTLGTGEQPLTLSKGVLDLSGKPIPLNAGTLNLGGRVDLNSSAYIYDQKTPLNLLAKIQINQKIAADDLFFLPFAWAKDQSLVGITGNLNITLKDANVPLNADKLKTSGTLHATLALNGLNANFPLVSSLLSTVGPLLKLGSSDYGIKDFNIPDIAITLENGRISYSNLVLKAGTVNLTFTGSVGMDKSLDMNVVLTESHIPIAIPIHMTGSTSAPKLDLKLTAQDLLKLNLGGGNPLDNLLKPSPAQPGAASQPKADPLKDAQNLLDLFGKPKPKQP